MTALPLLALLVLGQALDPAGPSEGDSILLAPKFGLFKSTTPLKASPFFGLEVGYLTPLLDRRLAVVVEGHIHQSQTSGTVDDPLLNRGEEPYRLTEREIGLLLSAVYRFEGTSLLTPYAGLGPGLYLHQATTQGFGATTVDKEGTLGFQLLGGAELQLGPGGLFVEAHYHFTRVGFVTTGEVNVGGFLAARLGYRLRL